MINNFLTNSWKLMPQKFRIKGHILANADVFIETCGLTIFSTNIRGLWQGAGELCAALLRLQPDVYRHIWTLILLIHFYPCTGYTVAAWKDRSSHGGGVLIMCKSHLLVNVIDCTDYYVKGTCEIVTVNFQGTAILCVYCQHGDIEILI